MKTTETSPVTVTADGLGRKFGREWIFRRFSYRFEAGGKYAITGHNGSGKTTLLRLLTQAIPATEGQVQYLHGDTPVPDGEVHPLVHLSGPYTELIEEFTLAELIAFYQRLKGLECTPAQLVEHLQLAHGLHKPIKFFSSGMKQKVKLGFAFFGKNQIICLDEPTANLDAANSQWYQQFVTQITYPKILIISSNHPAEYACCQDVIPIASYKEATG